MSDGILIASNHGREHWSTDLSKSIDREHFVVVAGGWELGKIKWGLENTTFDRLIFLQDSMLITDNSVFDLIAETPGSICLNHWGGRHLSCYLGVYEREVLGKLAYPEIVDKKGSYWGEDEWTRNYERVAQIMERPFTCLDSDPVWVAMEIRHGRENIPHHSWFGVKYREWIPNPQL